MIKEKRNLERLRSSLLGYPDSNQERQDQNLQCYHYTISQYPCNRVLSDCECKGTAKFCNLQIFSQLFYVIPKDFRLLLQNWVVISSYISFLRVCSTHCHTFRVLFHYRCPSPTHYRFCPTSTAHRTLCMSSGGRHSSQIP